MCDYYWIFYDSVMNDVLCVLMAERNNLQFTGIQFSLGLVFGKFLVDLHG